MITDEIKNLKFVAHKVQKEKLLDSGGKEYFILMEIEENKFVIPCIELYCNEDQIEQKKIDLYVSVKEKILFDINCKWELEFEKTMKEQMKGTYKLSYSTYKNKPLYGVLNPQPSDSDATITFKVKNNQNKTIMGFNFSEK